MEHIHTRFGKCVIADITQGQLEKFSLAMKGVGDLPMTAFYGKSVRQAVASGILTEPALTDEQVDASKPGLIRWLAECLAQEINEASNIDPL